MTPGRQSAKARLHSRMPQGLCKAVALTTVTIGTWGLFLERPGKLTGPVSYFENEVSRKVGCILTSNEVHFVSLAENFTVQFLKVLKLPSGMENKTA